MPQEALGAAPRSTAQSWLVAAACRCEPPAGGGSPEPLPPSARRDLAITLVVSLASAVFFVQLAVALTAAPPRATASLASRAVVAIVPLLETRQRVSWAAAPRPDDRPIRLGVPRAIASAQSVANTSDGETRVVPSSMLAPRDEPTVLVVPEDRSIRQVARAAEPQGFAVRPVFASLGRVLTGSGRHRVQPFPSPAGLE
ncbi:MAG TPA: hypothetical protein VNI83_06150 [Vicinamibacterales bacterium]|nr:hypothetical protein [Vicinamibacterales bacterium]